MELRTWLHMVIHLFKLPLTNSAWNWKPPASIQTVFGRDMLFEEDLGNTNPLRFTPFTNCALYLGDLRSTKFSAYNWGANDAIVYHFGLNEKNSGARQLVNCLKRDGASDVRVKLHEIYIAAPIIGTPTKSQKALLDLIEMLPNLKVVRFPQIPSLNQPYDWLYQKALRENTIWKVTRPSHSFWGARFKEIEYFDECTLTNVHYHEQPGRGLDLVYRALTRCDNIRSRSVSIAQGGCDVGEDVRSFDWKSGDKFSDLEELKLSGYKWKTKSPGSRNESTVPWSKAMDWSKLKRLDITRPPNEFLEVFKDRLSSVQSLTLRPKRGFWGDEYTYCKFDEKAAERRHNYTSFITSLAPLRNLSISGMGDLLPVEDILHVHGPTLDKLSIHEFERDCRLYGNSTWSRQTLSMHEIKKINAMAPNLSFLELDIHRASKWPQRIFREISKFQNLTSLNIWFNLENPHKQKYANACYVLRKDLCIINELMEPRINESSAEMIANQIIDGQKSRKLETIKIYAGDFGRAEGGGLRIAHYGEENNAQRYTCKAEAGKTHCERAKTIWDNDWDDWDDWNNWDD